jgi:hypothetical protein
MFHHRRDEVSDPIIVPRQFQTVRLLQTDEELQSAISRARAFEQKDEYERRVSEAFDRLLAAVVHLPPEDIDVEVHTPATS